MAFAELAGIACRNADEHAAAQRAATLDSLTGCLNHGAFQARLREEIARTELGHDPSRSRSSTSTTSRPSTTASAT